MTIRLIHVGAQESSARRFLPGDDVPDWAGGGADNGSFAFRRWADDQALASLTVRMAGDQHAVRVTLAALYEFSGEDDIPSGEDEIQAFYREHVAELMPFLRQAVHTASSQVWPIKPIMLDALATSLDEASVVR
jgi:hypothetical protein